MHSRRHDQLRCIVHRGGISVYDTITDGTVTWTVLNVHVGAFNTKQTFTSSGTFTAPVTGTYRITLQGGGGGGSGAGSGTASIHFSGAGGGSGAKLVFYEVLTAGTTYAYTVGAGGAGGAKGTSTTNGSMGNNGGDTSITVNGNEYIAKGGDGAWGENNAADAGGMGGEGTINGNVVTRGFTGERGVHQTQLQYATTGGIGGGSGAGMSLTWAPANLSVFGAGGCGGVLLSNGTYSDGSAGGDGYITFEYCDV